MQIKPDNQSGFSLIELLIVIAIISLLAAIGYPSYQNHMRDTRRATAQGDLMELAQFMERQYSINNTYLDGANPPTLPFTASPGDGATAAYNIALTQTTQNQFTLTATPTGPQTGDRCGNLTLNHAGQRTADDNNCWR